jgi:hypothetical protein
MKLKWTVGSALMCLLLVLAGSTAWAQEGTKPEEASQPRLEVPETSFNFGYVPQGVSISHRFWLLNTGGDTLFIQDVKPG